MNNDNLNQQQNSGDNSSIPPNNPLPPREVYTVDGVEIEPKITPLKAGILGLAGGLIFYQIVGGLISAIILGLNPPEADVNAVRLMNVAGQVLFILLPALVFSKIIYENVGVIIRFRLAPLKEIGLFSLGMLALIPLLQNFLYIQNFFIESLAEWSGFVRYFKEAFDLFNNMMEKTFADLLKANNYADYIIIFFSISIVPAVCEELMFRGFIQKSFELRFRPLLAILITSVFFGLYHFSPYSLFPLIALGFYIGYATYKTNSILVPVILHFLNNFLSVIMFYAFGADDQLIGTKVTGQEFKSALISFSYQFVLFAVILGYIVYYYRKVKITNDEETYKNLAE